MTRKINDKKLVTEMMTEKMRGICGWRGGGDVVWAWSGGIMG